MILKFKEDFKQCCNCLFNDCGGGFFNTIQLTTNHVDFTDVLFQKDFTVTVYNFQPAYDVVPASV